MNSFKFSICYVYSCVFHVNSSEIAAFLVPTFGGGRMLLLFPCQVDTLKLLEAGRSVMVNVPTNAGKSLMQLNASRVFGGKCSSIIMADVFFYFLISDGLVICFLSSNTSSVINFSSSNTSSFITFFCP